MAASTRPRYVLPGDLLGPGEVIASLGITRTTLCRWRNGGVFLEPWRELDSGPIWLAVDVEAWATDRAEQRDARGRVSAPKRDQRERRYSIRRDSTRTHFLKAVREVVGCVDCGTRDGKLDLDHRPDEEKLFNLAQGRRSWAEVLAELEKCDVRCAGCHRARHNVARTETSPT